MSLIYGKYSTSNPAAQGDSTVVAVKCDSSGRLVISPGSSSTPDFVQISADGTNAVAVGYPLYVTDVAVRAGEDATNNRVNVFLAASNMYSPAKTSSASFTTVIDILASVDISAYNMFTISVKNTGAQALTSCLIQASPDNTSWVTIDNSGISQTLAAGAIGCKTIGPACYHYIKVTATAASATTCDTWLNANVI